MRAPADAREWVSFEDPDEDRTWLFDLTFLTSRWSCIYGSGCQGVLTAPAPERAEGCCSYGAHLSGPEDTERVGRAAESLGDAEWQHRPRAAAGGPFKRRKGGLATRIVDGACIFLNRPGFDGGPGCALHRAALERGIAPMEMKPDVCWQLPLRREDSADAVTGHVTSTVTQWERRHWGGAGQEFAWWCTEAAEAFGGSRPVYLALARELVALVGERPYALLAAHLSARSRLGTPLPHPALRSRTPPGGPGQAASRIGRRRRGARPDPS